ncbi:hypothetical protein BGZ76_009171 [Entomortierella beljakovae]|nr:hypothetical protein BGZ76_009171 [Entomortierella beljakovae]
MGARGFYLCLTIFLFSQILTTLWPKQHFRSLSLSNSLLSKRSLDTPTPDSQCEDVWSHPDRCAFVEQYCGNYPAGLINYLHFYFCGLSMPSISIVILTIWLMFLFGFVGVAASDFFCPNLNTIAKQLHLSESMTGVTFLAFGNGSPDVFSTFSAIGAGSGSLAIGELVGAASFITSVVVGSMAIIKPFKVSRSPFLRDVSFFAGCILFTLYAVSDGKITFFESVCLILYYITYVSFVVLGNWWHRRVKLERELEERARNIYDEDGGEGDDARFSDDDDENAQLLGGGRRGTKPPHIITQMTRDYDDYEDEEHDDGYISPGPLSSIDQHDSNRTLVNSYDGTDHNIPPNNFSDDSGGVEDSISLRPQGIPALKRRASLLTAFEFNDVVRSLTLSGSKGRISSYDTSYYGPSSPHSTKSSRRQSRSPLDPDSRPSTSLGIATHSSVPQEDTSPHEFTPRMLGSGDRSLTASPLPMDSDDEGHFDAHFEHALLRQSLILPDHYDPANHHLGHVHHHEAEQSAQSSKTTSRTQYLFDLFGSIRPIYFPTLLDWDQKSPFVRFLAITSVPMVLLLTLTLPVIELREGDEDSIQERDDASSQIIPKIVVGEDIDDHDKYEGWSRTATTVQMLLAPVFIATVVTSAAQEGYLAIPAALVFGACMAFMIQRYSTEEHPPRFYGALCFVGFLVAITWIFLVANEVVGILQAFGMIFSVSDAILGLTIFAMGNSLGDLVANITIAKMGFPRMAFSACFGGPLLNMLLGVGISGTYMTLKTGENIPLKVSPTLLVSLLGVLMTLSAAIIIVPRNGYMMTRTWGWFLIAVYSISTIINVIIEVKSTHSE